MRGLGNLTDLVLGLGISAMFKHPKLCLDLLDVNLGWKSLTVYVRKMTTRSLGFHFAITKMIRGMTGGLVKVMIDITETLKVLKGIWAYSERY